ncbi:serine--tRNA ligase, mitochondrial [Lates japonicus]
MATRIGMVARVGGAALTVLKPVSRQCARQRTSVFVPHRLSHGVRSSLYKHVREGFSDKPELDMRAVCEKTDKVIANVEGRKGDLRADDVRKIVSVVNKV